VKQDKRTEVAGNISEFISLTDLVLRVLVTLPPQVNSRLINVVQELLSAMIFKT